jgi:hypothetical protein
MTSDILSRLYVKNREYQVQKLARIRHLGSTESTEWGGARLRTMLQCIYTIAFLCLLRFDEVLRIQLKDIEIVDKFKGHFKLILPFRKTHQYGGLILSSLYILIPYRNQTIPFILQSQRITSGSSRSSATMDLFIETKQWTALSTV